MIFIVFSAIFFQAIFEKKKILCLYRIFQKSDIFSFSWNCVYGPFKWLRGFWYCLITYDCSIAKLPLSWIDYLLFYVPLRNLSLIWRRHHYLWRAAKFRPMLGAQGLWAGTDLYHATPAVTQDLGFSSLIQWIAPLRRLLLNTMECGGSIVTRILTGPQSVASYDTQGGCWGSILNWRFVGLLVPRSFNSV
jgi:hypothetical protein